MFVADNPSSFKKGGAGIDYETLGSLLIEEKFIFGTALMLKNYECPSCLKIFLIIVKWILI